MLLTLTPPRDAAASSPATDLGYLLAKNPARVQSFDLGVGEAHVYYPEATPVRCTAALLLDLDPLALVKRARRQGRHDLLARYVNDRPYVASSFLSVALTRVFRSALAGQSRERPELAAAPQPFEATVTPLPCRGGEAFLRRLFEPLGYVVDAERVAPAAPYFRVTLRAEVRLADLLAHLYVLVPVLDDEKHYWVGSDEVDKLLAKGGAWLEAHPLREEIARRYLKRQGRLVREALARLTAGDDSADDTAGDAEEETLEKPLSLNQQRYGAVLAVLKSAGVSRVVDLGCGEGKLLRVLRGEPTFTRLVGVDVSPRALEVAARRLRLDDLPSSQRERLALMHGALTYVDARLAGFDAACLVEVIEHVDPPRLPDLAHVVFGAAAPRLVVVTPPNVEHTVRDERHAAGAHRHRDHRFEWTRAELRAWAEDVATRYGYGVRFAPIGPDDPEVGPPTQMAIFERAADGGAS